MERDRLFRVRPVLGYAKHYEKTDYSKPDEA